MAPLFNLTSVFSILVLFSLAHASERVWLRDVDYGVQDRKVSLSRRPESPEQLHFLPPVRRSHGIESSEDDLELLDICLLASVDGKFHALNRTSGAILWSMSSNPSTSSPPSALEPLVRTQHTDKSTQEDDIEHDDLYIIEPQSGNIYVLSEPEAPLQRLPLSMSQLVDMSPFAFPGDEEHRIFVGKKETSLLMLELETGRLKGTLDSECPWDAFADLEDQSRAEIDLDELDGTKPSKEKPVSTEILIGRTDYHIRILSKPKDPAEPIPPEQHLAFSTYGPNNQNLAIQSAYSRTPDNTYIQPTPNGEAMAFRVQPPSKLESPAIWLNSFKVPIVAVFDILRSSSRQSPIALLQPQPRLQDVIPDFDFGAHLRGGLGATFIGLIEDNGSLFAMSPEKFPLVQFEEHINYAFARDSSQLTIDAPQDKEGDYSQDIVDGGTLDYHPFIGDIIQLRKERERCESDLWDRTCVIGMRPVEASSQNRLNLLLPDRNTVEQYHRDEDDWRSRMGVGSKVHGTDRSQIEIPTLYSATQKSISVEKKIQRIKSGVMILAIFLVGYWYLKRNAKQRHEAQKSALDDGISSNDFAKEQEFSVINRENGHPVHAVDFVDNPPITRDTSESLPTPSPTQGPEVSVPKLLLDVNVPETTKPTSSNVAEVAEEPDDDEDSEHDGALETPGKKKGTRRRRRGKKNKGGNAAANIERPVIEEKKEEQVNLMLPSTSAPITSTSSTSVSTSQLVVSEEILGFGSHGTVVYRGSLQGRAVAVKRLLRDFVTLASREVNILQESDDHPNVIRYHYQETHQNFLYIALELCPASLADIIERPDQHREISNSFEPKKALVQITSGLRHLHALKIVHRDIKPQNILVSSAKKGAGSSAGHRMLISDFGLCRKLDSDQTSFDPTAHGAIAAGTAGWRAPEILRGEVKLDETVTDESQSSRSSVGTAVNGAVPTSRPRLTKSVDIFALGCLFYYTLTCGSHPYGDRYERDVNIFKDAKDLSALHSFGEEGLEAVDLISHMLDPTASDRPDTSACLLHPFFWNPARRLAFLQDASDRFEIMCRDPREPDLIELEKGAINVVGSDWQARLDKVFLDNLGKFRKYDGKSVQDLLRALRNKKHHYQDLPDNAKRHLGALPDGFLAYFTRRFPNLFMHVHSVISRTNLRYESMFKSYFELTD